jgi:ABC-2 type transport system ATP-binding protein
LDSVTIASIAAIAALIVLSIVARRRKRRKDDAPAELPLPPAEQSAQILTPTRPEPVRFQETVSCVEVSDVCKSFNSTRAVDDVSFTIHRGEIFGMVGPNGAGKTTAIRMMMDIVKPDSGEITLFGEPLTEEAKNRIGYLPEERGLYKKLTAMESLVYLATLKDVEPGVAKERASALLKQVNMYEHRNKKVQELSRGMAQIIQVVGTILHEPELVVLDEPFSGLDPVNTSLLKQIIFDLRSRGTSIIMSSHQMNEVETLCDRVLMINKGQVALYGYLSEIKDRYRDNSVFVHCDSLPEDLQGVVGTKDHGTHLELYLQEGTSPKEVLAALVGRGVSVDRFEVSTPSLGDIFIKVVKQGQ